MWNTGKSALFHQQRFVYDTFEYIHAHDGTPYGAPGLNRVFILAQPLGVLILCRDNHIYVVLFGEFDNKNISKFIYRTTDK